MLETIRAGDAAIIAHQNATVTKTGATPRIDSQRLLAGQRALVILHAGQEYHLRLTRNDKLILTK